MIHRFSCGVFMALAVPALLVAHDKLDLADAAAKLSSYSSGGPLDRVLDATMNETHLLITEETGVSFTILMGVLPTSSATDIRLVVRNNLESPIALEGIESTCGCIAAMSKGMRLPASGSGILTLRVTAPDDEMRFSRRIVLNFSGGVNQHYEKTVVIEGVSKRLFTVRPNTVDLSQSVGENAQDRVVTLLHVEPNFIDVEMSEFEIDVTKRVIKSWKANSLFERTAEIRLQYRDIASEPFDEWEEFVRLTHKSGKVFVVPVVFSLRGQFYVKPRLLKFMNDDNDAGRRFVIAASDRSNAVELESSKLICGSAVFEDCHTVNEIMKARNIAVFRLKLFGLPDSVLSGDLESRLEVKVKGQALPVVLELVFSQD